MSGMISGTDVIFETVRAGFSIVPLLESLLDVWPDALLQEADSDAILPASEVLTNPPTAEPSEFFVYRDQVSAGSWTNAGWTEEHANDMVHVLVVEDPSRPDVIQLTLVIDDFTGDTLRLVVAVFDALRNMRPGAPGEPRLLVAR